MKRVLIIGSCVSRDILSFDLNSEISLSGYFARSSMASIFAPPPFREDVYSDRLSSKFQQKIIRADILKEAKQEIPRTNADLILLDLIDERFSLFCTPTGVCTNSTEFVGTGARAECKDATLVSSGTDEFFKLWCSGWRSFVKLLEEYSLAPKLRLNKVYWATHTESGGNFLPHYSSDKIASANCFLERLYEVIESDLNDIQVLRYSSGLFVGANSHRWGLSPFHYTDAYYRKALDYLVST